MRPKIKSDCFLTSCCSCSPCGMKACSRWKVTLWLSSCHTGRPRKSSMPWNVELGGFVWPNHLWWKQPNLLSQHWYVLWSLCSCNLTFHNIYICFYVQQATSMSEGTFSRGWRGRRERRHLPSVFSSWARRAPLKVWTYQILFVGTQSSLKSLNSSNSLIILTLGQVIIWSSFPLVLLDEW